MFLALLDAALASAILGVIVAAGSLALKPLWRDHPYLAPVFGLCGLAAASYSAFLAYWLNPAVGSLVSVALVVGCSLYLLSAQAWKYWRAALPILLVLFGLLLLYLGFMYLWQSPHFGFGLAGIRFSHGLPPDNQLPAIFAERLAAGLSTHGMLGGTNGSDRPPLQGGFLLLMQTFPPLFGNADLAAFGSSVAIQMTWVLGLFSFLRALGVSIAPSYAAVLFSGVLGTTLLNSLYTWPKMYAAALVLSSCAVLLSTIRTRSSFRTGLLLAVVLYVFAMLAHGVSGFALPLVLALGLMACRTQGSRLVVRWTAAASALIVILYLPWFVYQRIVDPSNDRLAKWHLAGAIPIDGRSLAEAVVDSYSVLTFTDWLSGRVANIASVFSFDPLSGFGCFCLADLPNRRASEFFITTTAVGMAFAIDLVILALVCVGLARTGTLSTNDRRFLGLLGASLACILFWALLMFIPGSTIVHQGSQVWIFMLAVAPVVWFGTKRLPLSIALILIQFALTAVVYTTVDGPEVLRYSSLPAIAIGLVLAGGAIAIVIWGPMREGETSRSSSAQLTTQTST